MTSTACAMLMDMSTTTAVKAIEALDWNPGDYAAVYGRVSDLGQATVPVQIKMGVRTATAIGLPVPDHAIFQDEGISRDTWFTRPGFQSMLELINDPHCRVVIAWMPDRLTADTRHGLQWFDLLRETNTRLFDTSNTETDVNSEMSEFVNFFQNWQSKKEVIKTRQRVQETHMEKAGDGRLISRPPYGISVVHVMSLECEGRNCVDGGRGCATPHSEVSKKLDNVWIVNEEQMANLRLIYTLIADGKQLRALERELPEAPYRIVQPVRVYTRGKKVGEQYGGEPFSASNLRRMVQNPFYQGFMVWNQYSIARVKEKKVRRPNEREDWIQKPHALGVLIDPELFAAANRQIALRTKSRGASRAYDPRLFDGLVRCGRCGWKMYPKKRAHKRAIDSTRPAVFDYACMGYNSRSSRCEKAHSIPEAWLYRMFAGEATGVETVVERSGPDMTPVIEAAKRSVAECEEAVDRVEALGESKDFYRTPDKAIEAMKAVMAKLRDAEAHLESLLSSPSAERSDEVVPVALQELMINWEEHPLTFSEATQEDDLEEIGERQLSLSRLVQEVIVDRPRATLRLGSAAVS